MRFVGFLLGVGLLLAGFALGGHVQGAFDGPSFFIVVGCALAFTYVAHAGDLWRAMGLGFFGKSADVEAYAESVHVLQTLRTAFLSVGLVAALIGGISMSRGMDSFEHFGPAFAVLLLAPFYGTVFAELVVMPAKRRLEAKVRAATTG